METQTRFKFDREDPVRTEAEIRADEIRAEISELEEKIEHLDSTGQSITPLLLKLQAKQSALNGMKRLTALSFRVRGY